MLCCRTLLQFCSIFFLQNQQKLSFLSLLVSVYKGYSTTIDCCCYYYYYDHYDSVKLTIKLLTQTTCYFMHSYTIAKPKPFFFGCVLSTHKQRMHSNWFNVLFFFLSPFYCLSFDAANSHHHFIHTTTPTTTMTTATTPTFTATTNDHHHDAADSDGLHDAMKMQSESLRSWHRAEWTGSWCSSKLYRRDIFCRQRRCFCDGGKSQRSKGARKNSFKSLNHISISLTQIYIVVWHHNRWLCVCVSLSAFSK